MYILYLLVFLQSEKICSIYLFIGGILFYVFISGLADSLKISNSYHQNHFILAPVWLLRVDRDNIWKLKFLYTLIFNPIKSLGGGILLNMLNSTKIQLTDSFWISSSEKIPQGVNIPMGEFS